MSAHVAPARSPDAAREGNLLVNGDFERESAELPPDGWVMWGPEKDKNRGHYALDAERPHGGKVALRMRHPAGVDSYLASQPLEAIRPRKGMMYTVSFWARSDRPGRLPFSLAAFQSWVPYVDAPNAPGGGTIDVTAEWKQFAFEYHEGWDFFAHQARHLILVFRGSADLKEERTLWLDDVSVVERPSPRQGRLLDETELEYAPLQHRLRPGDALNVRVDAKKALRPATAAAGGLAFHRVAGWTGVPYDARGRYTLQPELEEAIRDLRLPMTRFYAVWDEPFGMKGALDRLAELCGKFAIPEEGMVLEMEPIEADRTLRPEQWAEAVRYAKQKGYGFRYWEVGNEPYGAIWGAGKAFATAGDYAKHVKAVSAAVREADPKGQVGMAIHGDSLQWCNYALRQAAGSYDFVVGHFYCMEKGSFENVVLAANYRILDRMLRLNALIKAYNPGREVCQIDTEWGMHAGGPRDERASRNVRNGNIVGTLHRAVRLIHLAREEIVRGACGFEMFTRADEPGFGILTNDAPEKRFLIYWLHYYFNRHLGASVLEMDGEAPYHTPDPKTVLKGDTGSGPLTPLVVTLSKDGKAVYAVAVNGNWEREVPCRLTVANFTVGKVTAVALSQDNIDAPALIGRREDAVKDLPATVDGQAVKFTLPPHSAVFVTMQ